ncbi:MAG: undecaprenyl/decaprenyl-phosphate alpha-N-acetylglucosaminyl 1-phosphate transferase [Prevotellaceae bacterium]|nr:undecaprenyl/decaprenyl-phosphate alpha-N-acetylglucosaminyl 1-phosphate transferase [Prevotellaceae bacterium]
MTINLTYIIIAFVSSLLFSLIGTPFIVKICNKHKLYDQPNGRKIHKEDIPRLGGTLFMPSMGLGVTIAMLMMYGRGKELEVSISALVMCVGAILIYLVGILDDLKGLKASHKFIIQCIAALGFPLCNLMINNLHGLFGIYELPLWISYLLTVFVILLIVNAMNLIDGIDGLASGFSIIILGALVYFYYNLNSILFCLISISLTGALTAFFIYNFFGAVGKYKIFMGDSGSLFLGYVISYLTIKYQMPHEAVGVPYPEEAFLISFTLVFIPCIDVIRVALQRKIQGRNIFDADKTHIHHMIMDMGFGMHSTLAIIICLFSCFCLINWGLCTVGITITYIFIIDVLLYSLIAGCIGWLKK